MGKSYKYKFATKEDYKLNDFLNKTIIGTAYNFFNRRDENKVILEEYNDDIIVDCPNEVGLFGEINNECLELALKSLTENERLVISFTFEDNFSGEEIAKIINITPNSLYRMRKKTLKKLKIIMEEIEGWKK